MVSDIHSGGLPKIGQTHTAGSNRTKQADDVSPGPVAGAQAVVTLTDLSARLQQLTAASANAPVVDQAKVQALRAQIEAGTYAIDDRQIADKLSAFEALLGSPAHE